MTGKKDRESNVELLRIVMSVGVIFLHYINPDMGGAFRYVIKGSINYEILMWMEAFFEIAVNVFVIMAGYFGCQSQKRNLWKAIQLLAQVSLISLVSYLVKVAIGDKELSIIRIVNACLPANYYAVLYVALFCVAPYINLLLITLHEKGQLKKMVITVGVIFSVWPTIVDLISNIANVSWVGLSTIGAFGSQWGYTFTNFCLLYIIGGYIRLEGRENLCKKSLKRLCLIFLVNVIVIDLWSRVGELSVENSAWEYCNPVVIINAAIIFVLFRRLRMGNVVWINRLGAGAYTVYLLHMVLIRFLDIEKAVNSSLAFMLCHMIISAVAIYLMCWLFYLGYKKISDPIWRFLMKYIRMPEIYC